jgi:RNA polymerase sigma factor (sigma-70 family)
MNAEQLFLDSLPLIDRLARATARKSALSDADVADFVSTVKVKLLENDYAVLHKFRGTSSLATYLTAVIHRLFLDERIATWGKWHASAAAVRLGATAVALERLLHRDGRSMHEAASALVAENPKLSVAAIEELAAQLPPRPPRRRMVLLEEADSVASTASEPPAATTQSSATISAVVRSFLGSRSPRERLLLQLHFESGMSVADIARSLGEDQKQLYRTKENLLDQLRTRLESRGISRSQAAEVVADRGTLLDFNLGIRPIGPSNSSEEVTAIKERLQ